MTYDPNHEEIERLVRIEENVLALRREIKLEFEGRDKALEELKVTTKEWKAQANEWRETVSDVGTQAKEEARTYVDHQIERTREYVDEKIKFLVAIIGTGVTILTGMVILEAFIR